MRIDFQGETDGLLEGISLLAKDFCFEVGAGELVVHVRRGKEIAVEREKDEATIVYEKKIHFYRGLGLLLEAIAAKKEYFSTVENPQFSMNGVMLDCSRNAVPKPETVKQLMNKMAIMGLDTLMLYTEDTYEIQGRPYFGYLRGRYSQAELAELDRYAENLGIEIIPCIQTLGHLEQVLKWEAMVQYRDTADILLVDDEKTYKLIEEMIVAASRPFRSKRIHIGMDEAHQVGLGRYLKLHGYERRFEIMLRHLDRVVAIARKYDLEPMIWSDMFFRLGSKTGNYYDLENQIPGDIIARIPEGVRFVYWDYHHKEKEFYREFIRRHRRLGSEPIFAGAVWFGYGFCPNYGKTFLSSNAALAACKEERVQEVFATIWNDDGSENILYSAMLGLQLFAEHGYSRDVSEARLKERFEFCQQASYDAFMSLKYFDETPGTQADNWENYTPSKYLLWQDLLLGQFDANVKGLPLNQHYCRLANQYGIYKQDERWSPFFDFYQNLALVLARKADLGNRISDYYNSGNRSALEELAAKELPALQQQIYSFRSAHRELWHALYKPFGWEVLDIRYGGLLSRIDTVMWRIKDYLAGRVKSIPELEERKLSYDGKSAGLVIERRYRRIATPSSVF